MSAPTAFDLATLDAWCGCRPGMTRAQVLAALAAAEVEADQYGQENLTVTEEEWELELTFASDGSERLRQLSLDGDAINWAGHPLMDLRVDEALRLMEPLGPAWWTDYDAVGSPFPDPEDAPTNPPSDEDLLFEGTIWFPQRGLGLVIDEGAVFGVAWRGAQDLPTRFAGPVTAAQRELSRQTNLETHLHETRREEIKAATPKDPLRFVRAAMTLAALAALALTARDGIKEMSLWSNAPTVKGRMIAVERGPMKQFFEYLPKPVTQYLPRWWRAGKWSGMPAETDLYRMEFTDPHDQRREVRLEAAEFYVPPREPGEEVDLVLVDEEPPRVKGPARARDAAFLEHVPWAICIGALWLIGHVALSFLPALLRMMAPLIRNLIPTGKTVDPDRPELS